MKKRFIKKKMSVTQTNAPSVSLSSESDKKNIGIPIETVENIEEKTFNINSSDDRALVNNVLEQFLLNIKPTTIREAANIQDDIPVTEKVMIVIVIDYLVDTAKKYGWALARYEDTYYLYTGTHWQKIVPDDLKSFLGRAAVKIGVEFFIAKHYKFREDLLKQFHSAGYFSPPIDDTTETKINLLNGTFIISKERSYLKPFDKADFIRYILPFPYDPTAHCPKFKSYLERVLPDNEKQKVIAEYLGYVFIRNSVLKLEKSLILYGSGANGKSVLFEIVQKLFGSVNVSNFTLQSLTDPTGYTRSLLSGKLVNYASEISSKMNPTLFKQLVSGEPVEARMIYGKPFILHDYARLIFNTNVLPKDIENNTGFFRRFIIIEFDQLIPQAERNPNLANEIIREELPGILNWVLEGLERLLQQMDFSECSSAETALERFRKDSDSVALFLEDGTYIQSKDDLVSLKEFYNNYKEFCRDANYTTCSNKDFSKRLRDMGFEISRKSSGRIIGVKKEA
jgi:putative DNA primase/helicase